MEARSEFGPVDENPRAAAVGAWRKLSRPRFAARRESIEFREKRGEYEKVHPCFEPSFVRFRPLPIATPSNAGPLRDRHRSTVAVSPPSVPSPSAPASSSSASSPSSCIASSAPPAPLPLGPRLSYPPIRLSSPNTSNSPRLRRNPLSPKSASPTKPSNESLSHSTQTIIARIQRSCSEEKCSRSKLRSEGE